MEQGALSPSRRAGSGSCPLRDPAGPSSQVCGVSARQTDGQDIRVVCPQGDPQSKVESGGWPAPRAALPHPTGPQGTLLRSGPTPLECKW